MEVFLKVNWMIRRKSVVCTFGESSIQGTLDRLCDEDREGDDVDESANDPRPFFPNLSF
jgi:hypothetical protein